MGIPRLQGRPRSGLGRKSGLPAPSNKPLLISGLESPSPHAGFLWLGVPYLWQRFRFISSAATF